jgi:UDP-N-acetylmuramoylalanine--D-glutamate ligase
MESFDGARVTVMGLGRFGGGIGVTRWLAEQGADVLVTDRAPAEQLEASIASIQDLIDAGSVELRLGEHNVSDFTTCDVVIANPAVPKPWENRFLRAAEAAGVRITTEIRLLVKRLPNRDHTIGVTGTAGKSTTSAMIAHLLRDQGKRVWLGGNIGGSLLANLHEMTGDDFVVLELSSAQLYWLDGDWSPHVAVLTNFVPNHLDWHGDVEHYRRSKQNIVLGAATCVASDAFASWCANAVVPPSHDRIELSIPGAHNRLNAALAIAATGGDPCALSDFAGLPHRLQFAGESGGVRIYNDSKCTTPEGAALAVAAFDEPGWPGASEVRLICGGHDKQVDLSPMVDAAARCGGVYTIGATGPALSKAVREAGGAVQECGDLATAVTRAASDAETGEVLLLSPGCASWDQFTNYEERGDAFVALAQAKLSE